MINTFLMTNKLKKSTGRDSTHLDMSGGVINIPPALQDSFLDVIAKAYDANEKYYLIETKTDICRAFMDLDFLNTFAMSMDIAKQYITVIQKSIKKLFVESYPGIYSDNHKFRVVVFTTKPKNVKRDGKDMLKTGIHLIWPEFISNKQLLMKLRIYVIKCLYEHFGKREDHNSHEDVVDASVFKGSGLRIPGASKMEICKACKNKRDARINCQVCNTKGRIEDDRRYRPYCVMDSAGELDEDELKRYNDCSITLFKELTIRTDFKTIPDEFNIAPKLDEINKTVTKTGKPKKKKATSKSQPPSFSEFGGEFNDSEHQVALERDDLFYSMQKFIRSREFKANKPYRDIEIKDILRCDEGSYYIVTTNCKFCLNLGDEHMNNNIYFYIDPNFIYQKCHCTCEKIRPMGKMYCKDWRSHGQYLDDMKIKKRLFPEETESQKGGKGGVQLELPGTIDSNDIKSMQKEERFLLDLEHFLKNKSI